ncbi:MAG: SPOR domain-containing protein [Planktomarina sp.]
MATPTYDDYGASDGVDNNARLVNLVGGIISLIVFLIIVGWGAKTLLRDASGVPVVEAIDGPIREAPSDPGGLQVAHQGLSVNSVASSASDGASQLGNTQLAPAPVTLDAGDQSASALQSMTPRARPVGLQSATAPLASDASALAPNAGLQQMAANMNAAMAPVSDLAPRTAPQTRPDVMVQNMVPNATENVQSASNMAVARSMRPQLRPAGVVAAPNRSSLPPLPRAAQPQTDAFDKIVPAGTPLAQMGAFDSKEVAISEWTRLKSKFSDYMGEKTPVIQVAQADGKTWYRLRLMGFEGIEQTRQFCSAIAGRGAACYPLVMR